MNISDIRSKLLKAVRNGETPQELNAEECQILMDLLDRLTACHSVADLRFVGAVEDNSNTMRRSRTRWKFQLAQKLLPFSLTFEWDSEKAHAEGLELLPKE